MTRFSAVSHPGRIILGIILTVACMSLGTGQTAEAGQPATHNVSTCADLETLGADSSTDNDTINLTADLNCTGITFLPLYTGGAFSGTFNGQGHSISNLTINRPGTQWDGLIAQATGATIQNLTLASGTVTGEQYVGGLVGQADAATISNVTSHLTVSGTDDEAIGGLIGSLSESTGASLVQDVAATGNVTVTASGMGASYVGGLIGLINTGDATSITIRRASATGNVSVSAEGDGVGGLIGAAFMFGNTGPASLLVQDAYATGSVAAGTSGDEAGGLIGSAQPNGAGASATLTLTNTYATGAVSGDQNMGGLIGVYDAADNLAILHINDSFATGAVTATTGPKAGLVGDNFFSAPQVATATNDYYDGPGTGQSTCTTSNNLTGDCTQVDTGAHPNYFKGNHTSAPMSAWDFAGVWTVVPGGYPVLIPADDGDGISLADEAAAPNDGDANGDGLSDAAQANVASFPDPVSGHYAVLQTSCGSLFNVRIGAEDTTAGQTDAAYEYPAGLMGFVVTGCTAGATATITQYFYGSLNPAIFTMREWNSGSNAYTTIPGATFSTATIGGQTALKAVYQITDGSSLDEDGTANGSIVDPAGPAVAVLGAPDTGLGGLGRSRP